jgi:phosphoribosylanthranilate isomerase
VEEGYRVVLAGGLGPDTVREAAERVGPAALDLNSGVESAPGRKDAARIRDALDRLRDLDPPDRRNWPW